MTKFPVEAFAATGLPAYNDNAYSRLYCNVLASKRYYKLSNMMITYLEIKIIAYQRCHSKRVDLCL